MEKRETELAKFAYSLDEIDAVIKAYVYEKEYKLEGLFNEFYSFREQDGTFNNTILEEFFEYIKTKYE